MGVVVREARGARRHEREGPSDARWRAAQRARAVALRAPEREREAARRRALEALRPFWDLQHAPRDTGSRKRAAEAAFRSGELANWLGSRNEALQAFRAAAQWGAPGGFGGRAWLELGHVHRRARRFEEALDAYARLVHEREAPATRRDEARLWAGRLHALRGETDTARRLWRACAEGAEDPVQRVRAWDELVNAWVESGDLEAAAGCLATAYARLGPLADELTEHGARVDRALGRMRCTARLAQAVRERRASRVASGSAGR